MEPNRAAQLMAKGCVWAEAVLLAVCQEFELEVEYEIVTRIAFGFAGGFGNTGAVRGRDGDQPQDGEGRHAHC